MGFQSAGIGRLCSWDRSLAGGLAVLFAGVGYFCGTAGAMPNEIGIPFAGVQVLCGGASGVASEVWVQSAGVGPTFCVTGCTANISGVLFDFFGTTTFFKDFAGAPSGSAITLFLFDVWCTRTTFEWKNMVWWHMEYVLIMDGHGISTYMMSKLSRWRCNKVEEMQDNICKIPAINKTLPN